MVASRVRARLRCRGLVLTFLASSLCGAAAGFAAPAPNASPSRTSDGAPAINPILALPAAPEDAKATPTPPLATATPMPAVVPTPIPTRTPAPTYADVSHEPLRAAIQRLKLPVPLPSPRIVVTKSQRRLELFSGQALVKSYRVALGAQPVFAKATQGDGRTPEGQFYICTRNASHSAFHIFLGLSYPALPDATRAVNHKAITWREYMIIRQRLASRGAPLWQTRLGGWVGIHGGTGGSFAQKRTAQRKSPDWTAGCIAVTDTEINEIYSATGVGTPVLVRP